MDIQSSSLSANQVNLTQLSNGAPVTAIEQEQNDSTTSPQSYNPDVFDYTAQQIPSLEVITQRIFSAMNDAIQKANDQAQQQKIQDEAQQSQQAFQQQLADLREKAKERRAELQTEEQQNTAANLPKPIGNESKTEAAPAVNQAAGNASNKTEPPQPVLGAGSKTDLENAKKLANQVSSAIIGATPTQLANLHNFTAGISQIASSPEVAAANTGVSTPNAYTSGGVTASAPAPDNTASPLNNLSAPALITIQTTPAGSPPVPANVSTSNVPKTPPLA